jgi:hypothetical protein
LGWGGGFGWWFGVWVRGRGRLAHDLGDLSEREAM